MATRGSCHRGDLRTALVEAALALIAERGVGTLSVAKAGRRTGVSPAAPYHHLPTRTASPARTTPSWSWRVFAISPLST